MKNDFVVGDKVLVSGYDHAFVVRKVSPDYLYTVSLEGFSESDLGYFALVVKADRLQSNQAATTKNS